MTRRAKKPLNQAAIDCADKKFYALNYCDPTLFDFEGRWIPLHPTSPEHAEYRKQWMDLYEECGGEVEYSGGGKKPDPTEPVQPCPDEIVLVEVRELVTHGRTAETRAVVTRDQYVNLDQEIEPEGVRPEYGRFVCLKARVEWKSGSQSGLAGHTVHWSCFNEPPLRNELAPKDRHGFGAAGSGSNSAEGVTDGEGWTEPVYFYLSTYGGEVFELSASLEPLGEGLPAGAYTVWRKFWYQVTEMKRPGGGLFELPAASANVFEEAYRQVFIDFEEASGGRRIAEYRANIAQGEKPGFVAKYFVKDNLAPFKAHLVMLERNEVLEHRKKTFHESVATTASWVSEKSFPLCPLPAGDGIPWLREARFSRTGTDPWRKIPEKRIGELPVSGSDSYRKIVVSFSGVALGPRPDRPVHIRIVFWVYTPQGIAGHSQNAYINVGMVGVSTSALHEQQLGGLCVHEMGHCLGLLNMEPAGKHDHDEWKDSHQHCSFNSCWLYHVAFRSGLAFHLDGATMTGCRDYLLRQDFSRAVMSSYWDS